MQFFDGVPILEENDCDVYGDDVMLFGWYSFVEDYRVLKRNPLYYDKHMRLKERERLRRTDPDEYRKQVRKDGAAARRKDTAQFLAGEAKSRLSVLEILIYPIIAIATAIKADKKR